MNLSRHPHATQLRLYALRQLKPTAALKVEEHTDLCAACGGLLERIQSEHHAMRNDLRMRGLSAHVTPRGPVSVWVVENAGRWLVRVIGPGVHLGTMSNDKTQAIRKALTVFAETFPDHECASCIGLEAGRNAVIAS